MRKRPLIFMLLLLVIGMVLPSVLAQEGTSEPATEEATAEPAMQAETAEPVMAEGTVPETVVQYIELTGIATEPDTEFSSLIWYNDHLILIAENPYIFQGEGNTGLFFALHKADILAYLDGTATDPLEPLEIPIYSSDIEDFPGFDGFEAAALIGNEIFLTVEAEQTDEDGGMVGYLVKGDIEPDLSAIYLDLGTYAVLPAQSEYGNMAYESLFTADGNLVALYEANGVNVTPNPVAYVVDSTLQTVTTIPMQNIEFRVTDATTLDAEGHFWVTNYFWPGEPEAFLRNEDDPIFAEFGMSASNAQFGPHERLLELAYSLDGITVVAQAPIQLDVQDENGRNWEGVERLEDRGLLVVTDKFPQTLLGFVPFPTGGIETTDTTGDATAEPPEPPAQPSTQEPQDTDATQVPPAPTALPTLEPTQNPSLIAPPNPGLTRPAPTPGG